jgi:acetyl-CoA C-acetyltransferase
MKAVIVSAARTPIGRFLGGLKDVPATDLGSRAIQAAIERAGITPSAVDECVMGNVVQAGNGQNPARQASLHAGMLPSSFSSTINVVCGSGMRAVINASQSVRLGDANVVVAGGMESMSRSPYLMFGAREGFKAGHQQLRDANIQDGLWCAFENWHMGSAAENTARVYGFSRDEQDQFALESHKKALEAIGAGRFKKEIVPVVIEGKKGPTTIDTDESPRADTSLDVLGKLKPAFEKDGTVTAGNAPGLNDGAAALIVTTDEYALAHGLEPIAEILGYASSGLEPKWFTTTPVPATRNLLEKLKMTVQDIDLFEFNEAFAVQSLAVIRDLEVDPLKVNVNGGAVALGHPIGCSGARIMVTLLHALEQRGLEMGVASLCMGGANGLAVGIKRL